MSWPLILCTNSTPSLMLFSTLTNVFGTHRFAALASGTALPRAEKAWDYILLRPAATRDGDHHHSMEQHLRSIYVLTERTEGLLATASNNDTDPSLFVNRLQQLPECTPAHVTQCALEMLLAGIGEDITSAGLPGSCLFWEGERKGGGGGLDRSYSH